MNGFQKLALVLGGSQKKGMEGQQKEVRLELATVITPPPDLSILVDGLTIPFGKDFLMICEGMTRHERVVTIEHTEGKERDLGDKTAKDLVSGDGLYFDVNDERQDPHNQISSFTYENVQLRFEDVLKQGDRVLVASVGSLYIIVGRVRRP